MKKNANFLPGTMGCHEALHTTHIIASMIDEWLVAHPAIIQNQKWKELAEKASAILNELYQEIGGEH